MRRFAIASGNGHASPRASTVVTLSIVNAPAYSLAAVLASGEPERLYSGLSLLVSTAADGDRCAGLASFRGLDLLLDDDLLARAENAEATPSLSWQGRETFARSFVELRDTALGLDELSLYACSASVETMSLTSGAVEERLDGVMSTPRFLRETTGAQLVFV
jgi:peroxiredoxin family protein